MDILLLREIFSIWKHLISEAYYSCQVPNSSSHYNLITRCAALSAVFYARSALTSVVRQLCDVHTCDHEKTRGKQFERTVRCITLRASDRDFYQPSLLKVADRLHASPHIRYTHCETALSIAHNSAFPCWITFFGIRCENFRFYATSFRGSDRFTDSQIDFR